MKNKTREIPPPIKCQAQNKKRESVRQRWRAEGAVVLQRRIIDVLRDRFESDTAAAATKFSRQVADCCCKAGRTEYMSVACFARQIFCRLRSVSLVCTSREPSLVDKTSRVGRACRELPPTSVPGDPGAPICGQLQRSHESVLLGSRHPYYLRQSGPPADLAGLSHRSLLPRVSLFLTKTQHMFRRDSPLRRTHTRDGQKKWTQTLLEREDMGHHSLDQDTKPSKNKHPGLTVRCNCTRRTFVRNAKRARAGAVTSFHWVVFFHHWCWRRHRL